MDIEQIKEIVEQIMKNYGFTAYDTKYIMHTIGTNVWQVQTETKADTEGVRYEINLWIDNDSGSILNEERRRHVYRSIIEHISIKDHIRHTVRRIRFEINWYALLVSLIISVLDGLLVLVTSQILVLPTYIFLSLLIYIAGHFTICRNINRVSKNNHRTKNEPSTKVNRLGIVFFILLIIMQLYVICTFEVACLIIYALIAIIAIVASYDISTKITLTEL